MFQKIEKPMALTSDLNVFVAYG